MDKCLYFIDASAGDMDPKQTATSPQIFIESIIPLSFKNIPMKITLIDQDQSNIRKLKRQYLKRYQRIIKNSSLKVVFRRRDMKEVLEDFGPNKYRYGLLYFDPNGFKKADYDAVQDFLFMNPRMDVLLNINVDMMKRVTKAAEGMKFKKGKWESYKGYNLKYGLLKGLHKKHIWIRDDVQVHHESIKSGHKFIMASATNMDGFDPNLKYEHQFVSLKSEEGQEIINKYDF